MAAGVAKLQVPPAGLRKQRGTPPQLVLLRVDHERVGQPPVGPGSDLLGELLHPRQSKLASSRLQAKPGNLPEILKSP